VKRRYLLATMAAGAGVASLVLLGLLLGSSARAAGTRRPATAPSATPDLIISVQAGDETVLADEVVSYTILFTNTLGDQSMDNVVVSCTLSSQQYYSGTYASDPIMATASFTYSGSFDDGHTLVWELPGPLPSEELGWVVISTTIPVDAEPPWDDSKRWPLLGASAVITTSTEGVTAGNPLGLEGDSASVMVVGPVLRINKADDPDPARPGRLLTYRISVENKDREDVIAANNSVITDRVPENTVFQHASGTGVYSPTSGLVIWHPPEPLARGSTTEVSFTVRLAPSMLECPPSNIENPEYGVRSVETIRPVTGRNRQTNVDDVLEKTIVTPDPPSGERDVFPGDTVIYTVSIYNPLHDQPLTGLRLTDTLPGEPNLFTFVAMVDGPAPTTTSPEVVWENLSVPAGGVRTLSFRAQVPYHTYIAPNSTSRTYKNSLAASTTMPGLVICDMKDQDPSRARVTRQIEMKKSVEPDHVLSGGRVIYTIVLQNLGDTPISSIRLTDTLPTAGEDVDFYFVRMVEGPQPVAGYQRNPVVWDGLSVPANDEISLSFEAVAIGWPLVRYGNNLYASSPWTTIPDRTNKAKVLIDPPLSIDKTVTPGETFVEEGVHYDVQICNVATGTYTLEHFTDYLPSGFYANGSNPYEYPISPPLSLAPGACWNHGFDVDVTIDVGCGNLPRTYRNSKGNVQVHVTSPIDAWFANASDLAPVRVIPHVTIEKERDHIAVLPGEDFVYTVTLINSSPIPVHDVTIVDTLHDGLEYVEMVEGPNPVTVAEPTVEWQDQTIPASDQLVLVFRVHVPETQELGTCRNEVEASTTDLACIKNLNPTAAVQVVEQIVKPTKKATPDEVPPLGIVRYEIKLKNKDSVPVSDVAVTDTLPSALGQDFEFVAMAEGDPEPSEVNGRQVIWRDLTIAGEETLRLRFDARGTVLFGSYNNDLIGSCNRGGFESEDSDDVLATVQVLPGVVLHKTVYPTHTMSGQTVIYTVTLNNQWTGELHDVRVTDTLPSGFSYRRTLAGPNPIQRFPIVAWELDKLGKGDSEEFVFQAQVALDVFTGTYSNKIEGHSPSALIPGVEETAPVEVQGVDVSRVYLPLVLRGYTR